VTTKTFVGSECSSDHVSVSLSSRFSRKSDARQPALERLPVRRLDDHLLTTALQRLDLRTEDEPEYLAGRLNEAFDSALTTKKRRSPNKPWWSSFLSDLRRRALSLLHAFRADPSPAASRRYSIARAAYNLQCRTAKFLHNVSSSDNIATSALNSDFSSLYRKAKSFAGHISIPIDSLRTHCGNLFSLLPSPVLHRLPSVPPESHPLLAPFNVSEVAAALKKMKSTAKDLNGLAPADLKRLSIHFVDIFKSTFDSVLFHGHFPRCWMNQSMFFLYKKGDKKDPKNYRSIAIENVFLKLFMTLIASRLTNYCESSGVFPSLQFGFRKNRSCMSAISLLHELAADRLSKKRRIYACAFDCSRAFDVLDRGRLMIKLQLIGVPFSLCQLLFNIFSSLSIRIKSGDILCDPFYSNNGTLQGDAASPTLFNIFLHDLPHALAHAAPTLFGTQIPFLQFADDLTVLADSREELEIAISSALCYFEENNLIVNPDKTKYIVFHKGRLPLSDSSVLLDSVSIPRVNAISFLGVDFSSQLSYSVYVNKIVKKANLRVGYLFAKLPLQKLPLSCLLRIFNTYILSIFHYGLPVYLSKIPASSSRSIDSVFSKFLKRYLRLPLFCSNHIVHFITKTEPLTHTLNRRAASFFYSTSFPPEFSGFRPSLYNSLPDPAPYLCFKEVPSKFWCTLIPSSVSPDPSVRRSQAVRLLAPLYPYYKDLL